MNRTRHLQLRENPRIVIPIVAGIGNALMAVPLVRQLKRGLPGSRICIVARIPPMAQAFERLPEVDEVRLMKPGSLGMGLSMLRFPRPDVCLIPFPSNRWQYMMLALAGGTRTRIMHGYPVGRFRTLGFLPAFRVPAVRGLHDVVQNLNLLRPFGIEPDLSEAPRFIVNDDDRRRAAEMLRPLGIAGDQRSIVIHAGSAHTPIGAAKRWPPECYGLLIDALVHKSGPNIVVLEGPDELGVADDIRRASTTFKPPVVALRGPLAEAAAVLERARLYVGSDSGLAHLAAAVGTPAVTLFAPSDPDRSCPFGCRHLVVQPRGRSCAPCLLYPFLSTCPTVQCKPPLCINDIHIDDVLAAVDRATETGTWRRNPG
ncbi:MAG: glycosyltransferase family 9 protein [Tepidisphaeraceae bacterium]